MYLTNGGETFKPYKDVVQLQTEKMFTRRAKAIRITSVRISGVLLYFCLKYVFFGGGVGGERCRVQLSKRGTIKEIYILRKVTFKIFLLTYNLP